MITIVLDLLALAALLFGLFFMFIGALGMWRLPDVFNRMHASSKCTTLGIAGLLLAAVLHLAAPRVPPGLETGGNEPAWKPVAAVMTKAALVIIFQFTAAPVGAHMLARAAHLDRAGKWEGTLGDELEQDRDPSRGGR